MWLFSRKANLSNQQLSRGHSLRIGKKREWGLNYSNFLIALDLDVCLLSREGKRQEESQKAAVQEVSITVSPPLHLKKEEQEKEKQRKAQELLIKIHTNKQRVSITFLLSETLNFLPSGTVCKMEVKNPSFNFSFPFSKLSSWYQESRKAGQEVHCKTRSEKSADTVPRLGLRCT